MRHVNAMAALASALSIGLLGGAAHAANLIGDGDFSTPNTGGGYGFFANGQVGPWMNTNGDALEVGASGIYGLSCDGPGACQNLEVNANTFDTVSQTVTLTAGKLYNLTWDYGGRPGGGPQILDVSFGGDPVKTDTGSFGVWSHNYVQVIGTGNPEDLVFASEVTGGLPSYGNEITNVALSAAPEPATWAMMLMGLLGLGAMMRTERRRQVATIAI
jgi:hypothetical protein